MQFRALFMRGERGSVLNSQSESPNLLLCVQI